ncbi:MAG: PEP-CTERM sorting domain-containing protein [Pirellulaceae bacterium]
MTGKRFLTRIIQFSSVFSAFAAATYAQVLPRDAVIDGKSIGEWSQVRSQWVFSYPMGMNPVEDATGELSYLGDQGEVFFLEGTFGGPTVTRDVTVRSDQYLSIGLLNVTAWIPVDGETEEQIRTVASDIVGLIDQLSLEIDGVAPDVDLFSHRQPTPPGMFDLVLPENAVFDLEPGTYPAVTDGYSVMLEPLSLGDHTVAFSGRMTIEPGDVFENSVVYNVHVVPEPSSWLVLGSASGCLLLLRRRRC